MHSDSALSRYQQQVLARYHIYNSIFMTLPFSDVEMTGALLPLFQDTCRQGFESGHDPVTIVGQFFDDYQEGQDESQRLNLLFQFIQYIERQVVLFDAIEDAVFPIINNMDGIGSLRYLKEGTDSELKENVLRQYLREAKVRIVLTAHPTQFYPGSVLGIITDLSRAIQANDLFEINRLMAQLGKTPFFHHVKPTPFDEAVSLTWFLENVFYHSIGIIADYLQENVFDDDWHADEIISIGFWPGGDRDGNPFVKPETTRQVADRLRMTIMRCYYRDIRNLKRKLTFRGVEEKVQLLEKEIYEYAFAPGKVNGMSCDQLLEELTSIRDLLIERHQSLYLQDVKSMINKVRMFRYHFASLDIRQDSRQHERVFENVVHASIEAGNGFFPAAYLQMEEKEQIGALSQLMQSLDLSLLHEPFSKETLSSMQVMRDIQNTNGEIACNRYIISNTQSALHVMQLFSMLKMAAFHDRLSVDIIPLFETVDDLRHARQVMETLYTLPVYRQHLAERGHRQTIMLGFSDGTKDGGYLMANWSIYRAKEELTALSRQYDVSVIFFDGRGGPPARGGGKTHRFYASLGPTIEDKEIQLTIQGQTISSNFGTLDSARYNMEQLLSAAIFNKLNDTKLMWAAEDRIVMEELAKKSFDAYTAFKQHPRFLPYLEEMSTLKYYAKTNIGSRPSKRGGSGDLVFEDLRAIPFVGSWSQLKQNVPGFYGMGTALEAYESRGEFDKVSGLYMRSAFFRTLVANSMMSLTKSFFDLTRYMSDDPEFGAFWNLIHDEFLLTHRLLLKLTGFAEMMEDEPAGRASIRMRESIVLPLLTIQQYALMKIREMDRSGSPDEAVLAVYEKLVIRSLFGNINASRNSA